MRFASAATFVLLATVAGPAAAEIDVVGEDPPPTATPPAATKPPAPAPKPPSTTVVAPPGAGVTVVAPTPGGGTVTASGCAAVQVEGSPTVVKPAEGTVADVGCAPYAPPDAAPRVIFVDSPAHVGFAPDASRTGLIVLGALGASLGGWFTGAWYLSARYDERSGSRVGSHTPPWIPWTAYTLTMALSPVAATLHVGATARGLGFAGVIAASVAVSTAFDVDHDFTAVVFGFLVPTTVGIVALATTPHAEDLAPRKKSLLEQVAVAPIADPKHGLTGATVGVGGLF